MTLESRHALALAVEIGRWPDGVRLTQEQKEHSMQALIAWDSYKGEHTTEPFKVQRGGVFNHLIAPSLPNSDTQSVDSNNIIFNSRNLD